jgi:alkanesulfonate monooxygenase SsuD/methylene tetrahydromethanopterin reductase-like flavin-dependent oxidoreductase (luciferase family)
MGFGIDLPQHSWTGHYDVEELAGFCGAADASAFDDVWVQESPLSAVPLMDPLSLLAAAAVFTTRIGLGTAMLLSPLHSPLQTARTIISIDQLSRGRVMVGIALGPADDTYAAAGVETETRADRFDEMLLLLRQCLTGDPVFFRGQRWVMDGAQVGPRPVQPGGPRVLVGGGARGALARAARFADGWIGAGASTLAAARAQMTRLRELLEVHGRDPARFVLAKRVYVCIDRDQATALARLTSTLRRNYGGFPVAAEVGVAGSVDRCIDGLGEVLDSGFGHVIIGVPVETRRHLELISTDVLPALQPSGG